MAEHQTIPSEIIDGFLFALGLADHAHEEFLQAEHSRQFEFATFAGDLCLGDWPPINFCDMGSSEFVH